MRRITTVVTEEVWQRAKRFATEHHRSMSGLTAYALELYLKRYDRLGRSSEGKHPLPSDAHIVPIRDDAWELQINKPEDRTLDAHKLLQAEGKP